MAKSLWLFYMVGFGLIGLLTALLHPLFGLLALVLLAGLVADILEARRG